MPFKAMESRDEIPSTEGGFTSQRSLRWNPEESSHLESSRRGGKAGTQDLRTCEETECLRKRQNNTEIIMPFLSQQSLSYNLCLGGRRRLKCQRQLSEGGAGTEHHSLSSDIVPKSLKVGISVNVEYF